MYIYATVISRIFKIQELEIKSVKLSIWLSIKFNRCVDQINCTLNSRTSVLMSTKNCKKFIPSIKANCLLPKSFSVHFIFHLVLVLWLVLSLYLSLSLSPILFCCVSLSLSLPYVILSFYPCLPINECISSYFSSYSCLSNQ
uniref:Uncharacterized protein n=1 Tax=Cacopsylla melanoneura TaxID=428564 RepID=A0A8D9FAL3_9HEMI